MYVWMLLKFEYYSDNDCNCNNNDADYNDDYCLMNDKVYCDSMNDNIR